MSQSHLVGWLRQQAVRALFKGDLATSATLVHAGSSAAERARAIRDGLPASDDGRFSSEVRAALACLDALALAEAS